MDRERTPPAGRLRRLAQRHRASVRLALVAATVACTATSYEQLRLQDITRDGWITLPGFRYKGELRNGLPHGRGEIEYRNGVRVQGTFESGKATGHATLTVPNWGRIEGIFTNGVLQRGDAYLQDGSQYTGQFRGWQFHGSGLLYRPGSGEWIQGEFSGGVPHGPATLYHPQSGRYTVATFERGAAEGRVIHVGAGAPAVRYLEDGRDVTADARPREAAAALAREARERAQHEAAAAAQRAPEVERLRAETARLRDLKTDRGIQAFNAACDDCSYGLRASRAPDGSISVSRVPACIIVSDPNDRRTPAEIEAARRAAEQRIQAQARACRAWANDFNDPSMPARLREIEARYRAEAARLDEAVRRRQADEAAAARYEAELRARRYSEAVRRRAAEAEARDWAAAREAESRIANQRAACSRAPENCRCRILRPPATPPRPGSPARTTCQ